MKTYTTKQGDKWDSIAYGQFGSSDYTYSLMQSNLNYINYYIFPAGITLILPETETAANSQLPPWKRGKS